MEQKIELTKEEQEVLNDIDTTVNALMQQRIGILKLIATQKNLRNAGIDYRNGALIVMPREEK